MNLQILRNGVENWWRDEGTVNRWRSQRVRKLLDQFLIELEELDQRTEALTLKFQNEKRETQELMRELAYGMRAPHEETCRRLRYDTRPTVWDKDCVRCRAEQRLEDLHIIFEAEE